MPLNAGVGTFCALSVRTGQVSLSRVRVSLVVAWKQAYLDVVPILLTESVIHTFISGNSFLLSTIYGSTNPLMRNALWDQLSMINCADSAWMLVGDFNCTLSQMDKKGGRPFLDCPSSRSLHNLTFKQGLIDLGFSGPRFTWSNNRKSLGLVQVRLDRAFGNSKFLELFPAVSIKHLARTGSDHSPLLITTKAPHRKFQSVFRFEHFWLPHSDLSGLAHKAFCGGHSAPDAAPTVQLSSALLALQPMLKAWNWRTFGVLEHRQKDVASRILDLETHQSSAFLSSQEAHSIRSLYNLHSAILRQLSIKWASKARLMWLLNGDSNSSFWWSLS